MIPRSNGRLLAITKPDDIAGHQLDTMGGYL